MSNGKPMSEQKRQALVNLIRDGRFSLGQICTQTRVGYAAVIKVERDIGEKARRGSRAGFTHTTAGKAGSYPGRHLRMPRSWT